MLRAWLLASALLASAVPAVADEPPRAGVVSTLQGRATVARAALPSPEALKFRDPILVRDRITTGDESLVRILMGEKAVVTIRERSVVVITEAPGVSTVDVGSGKVAVAVAREKLAPGDLVEVRTPNAVAGIRGTVVVAEVALPGAGPPASTFTVLSGKVSVVHLDPVSRRPVGNPVTVGARERLRVVGATPPRAPVKPEAVSPAAASRVGREFRMTTGSEPPPLGAALLKQELVRVTPPAPGAAVAPAGAAAPPAVAPKVVAPPRALTPAPVERRAVAPASPAAPAKKAVVPPAAETSAAPPAGKLVVPGKLRQLPAR